MYVCVCMYIYEREKGKVQREKKDGDGDRGGGGGGGGGRRQQWQGGEEVEVGVAEGFEKETWGGVGFSLPFFFLFSFFPLYNIYIFLNLSKVIF